MDVKMVQPAGAHGGGMSIKAKAHETLVIGRPYHFLMDSEGYLAQDITAAEGMVGVATDTSADGDYCEFVIIGKCQVLLAAGAISAGDGLIPDVSDDAFKGSGAHAGIIGDRTMTDVGVALEASAAGAELIDAFVNGLSCTCAA